MADRRAAVLPSASGHLAALLLFLLTLACAPAHAQAEAACGSLETHYGPYDYRTDKLRLPIVEKHHFTQSMANLTHRESLANLLYTLNAFPNHHPALQAMTRYALKHHTLHPDGMEFPIECYFERAMRFREDDYIARLLYVDFLMKTKRPDDAMKQLAYVQQRQAENGLTQFNIGLLYLEMGRFAEARQQAWRAAELGIDRPELREQLKAKGQWQEPPAGAASAPAATGETAAAPAAPAAAAVAPATGATPQR